MLKPMLFAACALAVLFAASCADAPPTSPQAASPSDAHLDGHTIARFADNCVFEDFFVGAVPSAKSLADHNWAGTATTRAWLSTISTSPRMTNTRPSFPLCAKL